MPYILKDREPVKLTGRLADKQCREWCRDHADEMIVAETIWPNGMSLKTVFQGAGATPACMFETRVYNAATGLGYDRCDLWWNWPSWGVAEEGHVRAVIAVAAIYDVEQLEKRAERCLLRDTALNGPNPR